MQASVEINIRYGFPNDQRAQVARLYWQAFGQKLGVVLGPDHKGCAFIEAILDSDYAISAINDAGEVLGVAGFKTSKGSLTGGTIADVFRHYGLGTVWRLPLLAVLERPLQHDTLLMDGICVAAQARGRGLGTQLLRAIKAEAAKREKSLIRLDVIDSNPRAKKLYLSEGFEAKGISNTFPFHRIFGFRHAEQMEFAVLQKV